MNWRDADQRFLLLLEPVLRQKAWIARITEIFALPPATTLVMTGPHYQSAPKPPVGARPVRTGER